MPAEATHASADVAPWGGEESGTRLLRWQLAAQGLSSLANDDATVAALRDAGERPGLSPEQVARATAKAYFLKLASKVFCQPGGNFLSEFFVFRAKA